MTSRKIYRTLGGGTIFKLVATLSDNTTTTYSDNIADGSLGTTLATSGFATGLEKFPEDHHRTAIITGARKLMSRNKGDSRSGGELLAAEVTALAQMWAEERIQHVRRRTPRYGGGLIYRG